jgi:hypothetical protein
MKTNSPELDSMVADYYSNKLVNNKNDSSNIEKTINAAKRMSVSVTCNYCNLF